VAEAIRQTIKDARPTAECPTWCTETHDPECGARLHRRIVAEWETPAGGRCDVAAVRYDGPDGIPGPATVRLLGDGIKGQVLTPAKARELASLFALLPEQGEGAQISRAFTAAADLIDPQ
jgi:hypothetical protein